MSSLTEHPHDHATSGFGDGERYQLARPDYPFDAITYLVDSLGIDEDVHVLDLGAARNNDRTVDAVLRDDHRSRTNARDARGTEANGSPP